MEIKIQLDKLRLAMDEAFLNGKGMDEIKKLHFAIRVREKQLLKHLFTLN